MLTTFFTKTQPIKKRIAWAAQNSRVTSSVFFHTTQANDNSEKAAVNALRARLGLSLLDAQVFEKAMTHMSLKEEENNKDLRFIGKRVTGLFATEFFHVKYPQLHPSAFEKTLSAFIGSKSFAQIATEVGMQHTVRWNRPEKDDDKLGLSTVLADCLHAVIGAIYQEQGMEAAKRFVHDFVLARDMDIRRLIPLDEPKRQLTALLRQAGKPRAESRILSETGRLSSAPVYVVGVFSKEEKLAEGFGSSIKMAEFRACQNALINHYGQEQKDFILPSDADKVEKYTPAPLGTSQALI
ncbi:hypothetical protein G6F46_000486 [Rhizopus delemar]|uniref:Large ribosomal subunit protein mL44 n=3 Tax=Rhizopus TaxID=4842 RepID=I1BJQ9_RHIO9|nr:hypothetical protein RO3G_01143 [Rhizopus delemar RA 99-880]KAG1457805.1 hypothetical protein G6F55_005714 [Rhizopus delemar]KAG1545262.1 hypothetical protein G6F51_005572 [Rhizopus arrhizus]KAG1502030.1 hypothetical protein G6F54_002632 [Rhizopus delemar]KAG1517913.1 hypothetical protein G6F53_001007 [Rhizopus delemar]|eukprot:EIE76439.1 hypothetical protein RO3G_01143 [Rhizopus delemar RA 99-880]